MQSGNGDCFPAEQNHSQIIPETFRGCSAGELLVLIVWYTVIMINMAVYMRDRRIQRRNILLDMLGGKCVICSSIDILHIDHIDPSSKIFELSGADLDKSWVTVLEELTKCQLLCSFHHNEKTTAENKQRTPWNKNIGGERIHGTARAYTEIGCRCDPCKLAKKKYRNKEISYTYSTLAL